MAQKMRSSTDFKEENIKGAEYLVCSWYHKIVSADIVQAGELIVQTKHENMYPRFEIPP